MGIKIVDVMLHIDEDITRNERESLRDRVLARDGVMAASYNVKTPHLLVVGYDPDVLNAKTILDTVEQTGVRAELVGL